MSQAYPDPVLRGLITSSTMLAAVLVTLDTTITNVVLPQIQASVAASPEQIVWVVTSYVIASAIATPLSGWLASRFGRKPVMVISVGIFVLASVACASATDLYSLVAFRFLQGAAGAAIVPLSQATLLDINPPARHGQAMAIFGMGSMVGAIVGPTLGGWLTEWLSWRAVFMINVPFGLLACAGMFVFLDKTEEERSVRFDMAGFLLLSAVLASLQLMIDRGQQLDWFDSREIWIEATCVAAFGYLFLIHIATTDQPFVKPELFRDRNFLVGSITAALISVLVFGALPLIGIMMQQLLGYPVMLAGLVLAPRGIATMLMMIIAARLMSRIDARILLTIGLIMNLIGFYMMAHLSLASHQDEIIISGMFMAAGSGLIFVPLTTTIFSTLAPHLRNEGTAMFSLTRYIGTSMGISLLQVLTIRNGATVFSRLGEGVRPDNPVVGMRAPDFDFGSTEAIAGMHAELMRQSSMVGYIDSFWLMGLLSVSVIPLIWLLRTPPRTHAVS